MPYKIFIYIFSLFPVLATSQSNKYQEYKGKWNEFLDAGETELFTWYHFVVSTNKDGNFVKRTFFPETRVLTAVEVFKDKKLKKRKGASTYYRDNRTLMAVKNYMDGKLHGEYLEYYNSDTIRSKVSYAKNKKEGKLVVYDEKGRVKIECEYKQDKLNGLFIEFDTTNVIIKRCFYENDVRINCEINKTTLDFISLKEPMFDDFSWISDWKTKEELSNRKMGMFFYHKVRYPENAVHHEVQGVATIIFTIEKDGTIQNFEIINGLCQEIKEECIRIANKMPPMTPTKINGSSIRSTLTINLPFIIEKTKSDIGLKRYVRLNYKY